MQTAIKKQPLMQEGSLKKPQKGYINKWGVTVNKKVFVLNQKQAQLLKDATVSGVRGIIWFDDFAISIPHIASIQRKEVVDMKKIEDKEKQIIKQYSRKDNNER